MKYFLANDGSGTELKKTIDKFLEEHPNIIIHSHQFATCGTGGFNKYVSIFYDDVPDYLTVKNKKETE